MFLKYQFLGNKFLEGGSEKGGGSENWKMSPVLDPLGKRTPCFLSDSVIPQRQVLLFHIDFENAA